MVGSLNIVFNKRASIIDLNPLAPVFLVIVFFAISLIASSLKISLTFSRSTYRGANQKFGTRGFN